MKLFATVRSVRHCSRLFELFATVLSIYTEQLNSRVVFLERTPSEAKGGQ